MKTPAKLVWITLAVVVSMPALAWIGTLLYWHVTITAEIRGIENQPATVNRAYFVELSGGCRTLPYLIDVLETSRHPSLLETATLQISIEVGEAQRPTAEEEMTEVMELLKRYPFTSQDPPEVRRANHQQIRAWWEANRTKHHQWWRVWSSNCSGAGGE